MNIIKADKSDKLLLFCTDVNLESYYIILHASYIIASLITSHI